MRETREQEQAAGTRWRKRPVVIEAVQWTGGNLVDVIAFTDGRHPDTRGNHAGMKWEEYRDLVARDGLKIFTLEGTMRADVGDWIIRGVKGECYPCKPDIFAATYEPATPAPVAEPSGTAQGAGVVAWARHGSLYVWRPRPWLTVTVQETGPGLVGRPPRWFWVATPGGVVAASCSDYATPEAAQASAESAVRDEFAQLPTLAAPAPALTPPAAQPRVLGFVHCEACGHNNHWTGEPPQDCRGCGTALRAPADAGAAVAYGKDVFDLTVELVRQQRSPDDSQRLACAIHRLNARAREAEGLEARVRVAEDRERQNAEVAARWQRAAGDAEREAAELRARCGRLEGALECIAYLQPGMGLHAGGESYFSLSERMRKIAVAARAAEPAGGN